MSAENLDNDEDQHHHHEETSSSSPPSLLFPLNDHDASVYYSNNISHHGESNAESIFIDIIDDDDDELQLMLNDDDDDSDNYPAAATVIPLTDMEERILSDRETRLFQYTKDKANTIECCILVGVEDLSSLRKARKESRSSRNNNNEVNDDGDDFNFNDNIIITNDSSKAWTLEESMGEMRELIKTAGLCLKGEIIQRLQEINPKTYIGSGKVKEARALLDDINGGSNNNLCCTVVFDAELTPGQQRALENAFNRKVIENDFSVGEDGVDNDVIKVVDRTALILDIFAQHARTREGKLQVDLALHEYRRTRLTKMWTHLERQSGAGGVGLRGPGETQLEVDKRILRDRINLLKSKIDDVQKQRGLHRRGRERGGLPTLSLVGYTNAGKSTLLNRLTDAGILAENILFATVDPTTRRVKLPGYRTHPEVLLTDTVGFIQKLPTQLVAAFRATLEEVKEADVLVHIM
jgi:50S ribosomal subunit-associated GTPase HflX